MPAKHGHDGKDSLPGFTGLSGDYDGDNKNESNSACDPTVKLAHGEDQATAKKSPCLTPSWVKPRFDISDLAGHQALIRWRYFTDGAAVMRGVMIDNVTVTGVTVAGDFESAIAEAWQIHRTGQDEQEQGQLAPYALALGDKEALRLTLQRLPGLSEPRWRTPILQLLAARLATELPPEDAFQWAVTHYPDLKFDPASGTYGLE